MPTEKKAIMCEVCGAGPFRSHAGLAGHLHLVHSMKPGKALGGVQAEQLVEGQEELARRMGKLEAVVSEVEGIVSQAGKLVEAMSKQLPERLDKTLAAHRERQEKQLKPLLEEVALIRRMYQSLDDSIEKLVLKGPEAVRERYTGRIGHGHK